MLTGNKNIDTKILNQLEDRDLVNVCQTNKLADQLCKDQTFWLNRILLKSNIPIEILNKYKDGRTWSEYYIEDLSKITPVNANHTLLIESQYGRLDLVIMALNQGANIHFNNDEAVSWASQY